MGRRFRAGRNFRVEGRLIVRGPGRVEFGDDVTIGMTVTPWTYHPDALISIGHRAYLNGTSFGCRQRIEIGADAILANARIMDTDFHSTHRERHTADAPIRVAPVVLEENVWVAAQAGLLPGTRIGRNSVVGFGAVCSGDYPADTIIGGNPARPLKPIPESPADA
jgi:maltose O-acetyltransferase